MHWWPHPGILSGTVLDDFAKRHVLRGSRQPSTT